MAWHLRKKPAGLKAIGPVKPVKPIQAIKAIQPIRPIKPIAPIGYSFYWVPPKRKG